MDMVSKDAECFLFDEAKVPREIALLIGREREIGVLIYRAGRSTANEVRAGLSKTISNPAVRSMLNRLVRKGILGRTTEGNAYVYFAALTVSQSRKDALRQFANDHFGGSVHEAKRAMEELLNCHQAF